jgi:hypothetical protein
LSSANRDGLRLNPSGHSTEQTGLQSTRLERAFNTLRTPAQWHATCLISVRIGDAAANPKEGETMKNLTTKFMIATAALVVTAGAASAQALSAQIPFEFRVGNRVMAPGTYQVDKLELQSSGPIFRVLDMHSRQSVIVLPEARVDPQKGWAVGEPKLVFACISGGCALAELWAGSESYAYAFARPKPGKDEDAYLRVIPMQRDKGE